MTHTGQSMINLWLVISEKAARIVIGMIPYHEILQVLQMLVNAKAISQRKLLEKKEIIHWNTHQMPDT